MTQGRSCKTVRSGKSGLDVTSPAEWQAATGCQHRVDVLRLVWGSSSEKAVGELCCSTTKGGSDGSP